MFSVTAFYQPDSVADPMTSALYAGLHRFAWCVGTGWLIIACATGHGGFLNKLLSWRALVPLSRLTYCAYLMNGLIELYALATVRTGRYMSVYTLLSDCLSHLCLTFLGALILCVMFESPMHGLQKILIDKFMKSPKKSQETNNEA
ncbi:O-acyltransferase like protein-like [Ctenocephalides felis]|nr:O-acyltransferase like protein-like [Ctenocephalides felis]